LNCLDSDILIAFLRGNEEARDCIEGIKGELGTTVINAFEILYQTKGLSERKRADVEKFLRLMTILPFEMESVIQASNIGYELARKGKMLDNMDLFIGAIAKNYGSILFTRNDKHFSRIKGLELKKW